MRMNHVARVGMFIVVLGVLVCPSRLGAQMSEQDIIGRIESRIEEMKAAKGIEAIIKARDGFLADYKFVAGKGRGALHARHLSRLIPAPLLVEMTDRVKQINTAMAMSKIPQADIQPLLDVMAAHPNPAVRYLGWRGYLAVRLAILSHRDAKRAEAMFAVLKDRAKAEDSPVVIRSVLAAATFPAAPVGTVTADRLAKAHEQSLGALADGWRAWCRPVLEGNVEPAGVGRRTVAALLHCCRLVPKPAAAKKQALQLVYEMMHCSSLAYDKAKGAGPVADANAELLGDCEKAMIALSDIKSDQVQKALKLSNPKVRSMKVRIAAIKWGERLKLQKPKFEPKRPATKPATRPATRPSTKPSTKPAKTAPKAT